MDGGMRDEWKKSCMERTGANGGKNDLREHCWMVGWIHFIVGGCEGETER